jgi:hypothetical protein
LSKLNAKDDENEIRLATQKKEVIKKLTSFEKIRVFIAGAWVLIKILLYFPLI